METLGGRKSLYGDGFAESSEGASNIVHLFSPENQIRIATSGLLVNQQNSQ